VKIVKELVEIDLNEVCDKDLELSRKLLPRKWSA